MSTWDLRLGDCLDPVTGLASLPDQSVDHTVSDPPYGKRTHEGQQHERWGPASDAWVSAAGLRYDHLEPATLRAVAAQLVRVTRKWILVMTSHDLIPAWEEALGALGRYVFAPLPILLPGMNVRLQGDGPSSWAVYLVVCRPVGYKDGTKPGGYTGSPGTAQERALPVKGSKPLWLMEQILEDYTAPGDLILDPFAGAGTTLLAAARKGRRALGFELNPTHYEIARRRLAGEAVRAPAGQMALL